MTSELAACRCGKLSDVACTRLATQEDFLCDACRKGCAVITLMPFQGAPGSRKAHYELCGWRKMRDDDGELCGVLADRGGGRGRGAAGARRTRGSVMNVTVVTDTKANDRVIGGTSFTVDDKGFLRVMDGSETAAIFAPGAWLSVLRDPR